MKRSPVLYGLYCLGVVLLVWVAYGFWAAHMLHHTSAVLSAPPALGAHVGTVTGMNGTRLDVYIAKVEGSKYVLTHVRGGYAVGICPATK